MDTIKVKDKEFELFLTQDYIEKAIDRIAKQITSDLQGKNPLFICVLNGSFMFASELMKRISIPAEISFVKMSSYSGTSTNGEVKKIFGLQENIKGRTIVIIEDIIDTGYTMENMLSQLSLLEPAEIKVVTLLLKPKALKVDVQMDYVALEIPNDFIVGYGLDYDGHGRNYPHIFKLKN